VESIFDTFQLSFHHKFVFTLENIKSDLQATQCIKKYPEMTETGVLDIAKLHEKWMGMLTNSRCLMQP
jgi:hypothetical protein